MWTGQAVKPFGKSCQSRFIIINFAAIPLFFSIIISALGKLLWIIPIEAEDFEVLRFSTP